MMRVGVGVLLALCCLGISAGCGQEPGEQNDTGTGAIPSGGESGGDLSTNSGGSAPDGGTTSGGSASGGEPGGTGGADAAGTGGTGESGSGGIQSGGSGGNPPDGGTTTGGASGSGGGAGGGAGGGDSTGGAAGSPTWPDWAGICVSMRAQLGCLCYSLECVTCVYGTDEEIQQTGVVCSDTDENYRSYCACDDGGGCPVFCREEWR